MKIWEILGLRGSPPWNKLYTFPSLCPQQQKRQSFTSFPPILGVEGWFFAKDHSPRVLAQNWLLRPLGQAHKEAGAPQDPQYHSCQPLLPSGGSPRQSPPSTFVPFPCPGGSLTCLSLNSLWLKKTFMKQPLNARNCVGGSHPWDEEDNNVCAALLSPLPVLSQLPIW